MATREQRNHARSYLRKAEEYLASAEANLVAERYTVAAGDAIHAGICAKDASTGPGPTMELLDSTTGELSKVCLFVAGRRLVVLPRRRPTLVG